MKLVIQRVSSASVEIEGFDTAAIGPGLLILCGVGAGDTEAEAAWLAGKAARLRIFADEEGNMNRSLLDVGGEALVVSQFTLYGDSRKGNRPSFTDAADPDRGKAMYERFVQCLEAEGVPVKTGIFRAMMKVSLINEGPVTLMLERSPGA